MSEYLLHPELIESVHLTGPSVAAKLDGFAGEVADRDDLPEMPVSVVIRAINEAESLERLLQDFNSQDARSGMELIVVDNESTDGTPELARAYGAQVVTIPREDFSYARSLNAGMEAASFEHVFLTVGHALLSNTQTLRGGVQNFVDDEEAGGAFARVLVGPNASHTERLIGIGNWLYMKPTRTVAKMGLGVLSATNMMISKAVWEECGHFDEKYGNGGEDGIMAQAMLDKGFTIYEEPTLALHHTHGLGPINYARQARAWTKSISGPQAFDRDAIRRRRPDLKLN